MSSSSPMLDRLTSPESRDKEKRKERQARYTQVVITAILFLLAAAWVVGIVRSWLYPTVAITQVTINDTRILGPSTVCPGDILTVTFTFDGDQAARMLVDATTTEAVTGRTVAYSTPHPLIYDGNGSKPVDDPWVVTNLPPGPYKRLVAVSAPSRSTAFDGDEVEFNIDECLIK